MDTHKSKKISEVMHKSDENLNLHQIKAKTGAGNGYKSTTIASNDNVSGNQHKGHNIYDVVTKIEGKANIHKVKAAGNSYKYYSKNAVNNTNTTPSTDTFVHKSHRIHALFHNSDRKLNLHEIKARTGAGNGYKH